MRGGRKRADAAGSAAGDPLAPLLAAFPLTAAPFVVTLYGDVAAPRGGELWTGSVVETLGAVGVAESRVRTALSRLVAGGHLEGTKAGRRSYYRLTATAAREFSAAARLIYAPVEPPRMRGWHLVLLPEAGREAAVATLVRLRFGFAAPQLALLPDRGAPLPPLPGCHFTATTDDDLGAPLADAWPLTALAGRMHAFVDRFAGLDAHGLAPAISLALRLVLVHAFREIALRDPLLPPSLLPPAWPGPAARAAFVRLYRELSASADPFVAAHLLDRAGPLRPDEARLARRRADMGRPPP